jgi:hypothetical protein
MIDFGPMLANNSGTPGIAVIDHTEEALLTSEAAPNAAAATP